MHKNHRYLDIFHESGVIFAQSLFKILLTCNWS